MNPKIYQLLLEMKEVLTDIFQSGMFSVHDTTIEKMKELASLSSQYGLAFAGNSFTSLAQILEGQRHTIKEYDGEAIPIFCKLNQYINVCIKKVEYDDARNNMIRKEEE